MSDLKSELQGQIPKLRAYALVLSKNASEADDLVQETLLRAWRFRDQFQPGTNLRAWLFRILRNAFLTSLVHRGDTIEDVDQKFSSRLSVEPAQEWRLRYVELLDGLDQISASGREALLLVSGAGLTYEEAAVVCGCSVGTVKSRVNRARSKLAALLDVEPAPEASTAPAPAPALGRACPAF